MKLLLFLCINFSFTFLHAQKDFGIKAGVNFSTLKNSSEPGLWGYQFGLFLHNTTSRKLFFQPEIIYSRKGGEVPSVFLITNDIKFHYINLPLLLGYKFSPFISFASGPELGLLLSVDERFPNADGVKDHNTFELGWNLGFMCRVIKKIGFDIRYVHGLTTAGTQKMVSGPNQFYNTHYRNMSFQAGLTYRL